MEIFVQYWISKHNLNISIPSWFLEILFFKICVIGVYVAPGYDPTCVNLCNKMVIRVIYIWISIIGSYKFIPPNCRLCETGSLGITSHVNPGNFACAVLDIIYLNDVAQQIFQHFYAGSYNEFFFKVIQKRPCVLIWPGERIAKNKNTIIMYR
jgi:hypothetical protein